MCFYGLSDDMFLSADHGIENNSEQKCVYVEL